MKRNISRNIALIVLALIATAVPDISRAQNRWIEETQSTDLGPMLRDEIRDRAYVADSGNGELIVIDTVTETVVQRLALPGRVDDIAISKNHTFLDVAAGGVVTRFHLNNLKPMRQYALPDVAISSVAFDAFERVVVFASSGHWGRLYYLNPSAQRVIHTFGVGPELDQMAYDGLVRTDPTGTVLYVGRKGTKKISSSSLGVKTGLRHPC